jgi:deoxycytidylate deaminase
MLIKNNKQKRYMSLAKSVSENSLLRFKVGAVLVQGNTILSAACNMRKTHPKFGSGEYQTLHAEGHALYKAVRNNWNNDDSIYNATIYIYRENGNLAKPCECCQRFLDSFNIEAVYSDGTTDEF